MTAILGIEREKVVDAEWLDNGPGWVGLLLDSAHTVLELRPDASAHPGRWDIGVIGPIVPRRRRASSCAPPSPEGPNLCAKTRSPEASTPQLHSGC